MKRNGQLAQAESLLLEIVETEEANAKVTKRGVATWWYEQLAILYRRMGRLSDELAKFWSDIQFSQGLWV